MSLDLNKLLLLAEHAAREAGEILAHAGGDLRAAKSAIAKDIKLAADEESEKLIRRLLGEQSGFPVVGEELGGDEQLPLSDVPYWVVDPLDGTYNYFRDHPGYAVSIALLRGLTPLLGVVLDFSRGELFSGIPGQGLRLNGDSISPVWAESVGQAMLSTGFPAARDYSPESLQNFILSVRKFKKIRMMGAAALASTYVACGRVDVYSEEGTRLWDFAGGWALTLAAGGVGRVTPNPLKPFCYDVWLAGNQRFLP